MIYDSNQLVDHRRKYGTKLYINIFTLDIVCFACNTEILDETFTRETELRILNFKWEVKKMVCELANGHHSTLY